MDVADVWISGQSILQLCLGKSTLHCAFKPFLIPKIIGIDLTIVIYHGLLPTKTEQVAGKTHQTMISEFERFDFAFLLNSGPFSLFGVIVHFGLIEVWEDAFIGVVASM